MATWSTNRRVGMVAALLIALAAHAGVGHAAPSPPDPIPIPKTLIHYMSTDKRVDITRGDYRLVVFGYRDDEKKLPADMAMVAEADVVVLHRQRGVVLHKILDADDNMLIDFRRAAQGEFTFVSFVGDPRPDPSLRRYRGIDLGDRMPFVATSYTFDSSGQRKRGTRLLIAPEEGDEKRIEALKEEAAKLNKAVNKLRQSAALEQAEPASELGSKAWIAALHIRNLALRHPQAARAAIAWLEKNTIGFNGGCCCETLADVRCEVDEIIRIMKSERAQRPTTRPAHKSDQSGVRRAAAS